MKMLNLPNKKLRSKVIKEYLRTTGINRVVCFSCGNASKELKNAGLNVLDISPFGDLTANKWFYSNDILKYFNNYFNATSGYLPFDLMYNIGQEFKNYLGDIPNENYIACGSGETLVCLKLAYPQKEFVAVYDNNNNATKLDKETPLFPLVKILAKDIIIKERRASVKELNIDTGLGI